MKTIIAPTDFSESSLNAVNYAADMACVIGANLSIIHACTFPKTFTEVTPPIFNVTTLMEDAEKELKLLKEKLSMRTGGSIKISTKVILGDVISVITKYCDNINPYAIVMGPEGKKGLEQFLLGGTTISSIRTLNWPLIIVPPGAKFTGIRKIGLACDFKDVADTIPLDDIKSLLKGNGKELHVMHVSPDNEDAFMEDVDEEAKWLQDIIGDLKPKYHFIEGKDFEKNIIDFAEKNNIDLLIVIPKKHNVFSKLFRHSFSRRLVLQSHIPVMAIHE